MSTTMGLCMLWAFTSVVRSQQYTFLILLRSGWQSLGTCLEHCLCTFNPQSVNKEATLRLPGPFVKAQHKFYVTKNKNENTRSLLYLSEISIPLRGDAVHKVSMKSSFTHETYIIPFFSVILLCGWTIRIEHLMEIVLVISQVVCMLFFSLLELETLGPYEGFWVWIPRANCVS